MMIEHYNIQVVAKPVMLMSSMILPNNWTKCDITGSIVENGTSRDLVVGIKKRQNEVVLIMMICLSLKTKEEDPTMKTDSDEYILCQMYVVYICHSI